MKSKIINLNSNNIKIITRSLLIGKTIVIPTDTVYGIAADAKSFQGVENIFKIKKRPKRFPLILFTHSIAEAKKLAIFSPFEEYLASKYWPGPLTLILKKKGKKFYNGDKRLSKVGIRIPKNKDVIKILEYIQKPLATTSANIHGEINIKSLNQLGIIKSKDVAYAIEKKGKMSFKESTLVETKNNQINIIREGSLSKKLDSQLNILADKTSGDPNKIRSLVSELLQEGIVSTKTPEFLSLSRTPSTLVINSNLLDFNDFAIAPAAVSPLILYG